MGVTVSLQGVKQEPSPCSEHRWGLPKAPKLREEPARHLGLARVPQPWAPELSLGPRSTRITSTPTPFYRGGLARPSPARSCQGWRSRARGLPAAPPRTPGPGQQPHSRSAHLGSGPQGRDPRSSERALHGGLGGHLSASSLPPTVPSPRLPPRAPCCTQLLEWWLWLWGSGVALQGAKGSGRHLPLLCQPHIRAQPTASP